MSSGTRAPFTARRTFAVALICLVAPSLLLGQRPVRDSTVGKDTLAKRPRRLEPVTITTTRSGRDEPVAATNVSPALIQTTPATNAWDLLRQVAGVEVHDQGQGPGFASDASIRGFSSDHSTDLALWIDGVPINEPVNGHSEGYNDWSLIFPQAIHDLDVIKGPASALFGNFALAGVVNVRTLERMRGTDGYLSGGAYGRAEGAVLTGFDGNTSGGVFGVRGLREDGWRPNSGYALLQGHSRLVRELSPTATIDAGIELYGARWDSPGFLTAEQFDLRQFDSVANGTDGGFKRRAQERISLRVFRGRTLWRSTVYATQGRWELFLTTPPEGGGEEGSGSQTEEQDSRFGFGATSAASVALGHGEVTFGVEGRFDRSRYENWQDSLRAHVEEQERDHNQQVSGAVFVQGHTLVMSRLTLSLGARYDAARTRRTPFDGASESGAHSVFSPKIGALVRVTPALALYSNVSRGFRAPDNINTHPELDFITAWSYEAGAKVDRPRFTGSAAAFQMDVSDEQQFSEICGCSVSGGASRRRGVEISGDARVAKALSLSTDWTLNDAKYRHFVSEDGEPSSNAVRVFNTARYVGIASVTLAPPAGAWTARISGNVVGPYTPFDEEAGFEIPAYGLVHAAGSVRISRSLIEFGVRNVLDRNYPELRAGGFVAPGQPRTLYVKVRHTF